MKKTDFGSLGSKVAKFVLAGAVMVLVGVSACKKDNKNDNNSNITTKVTEADAAQLTTDAIVPSTGGFGAQVKILLGIYVKETKRLQCGAKKDTTISYSSPANFIPNYSYNLSWNYQLDCNAGIPSQFEFGFSGSSSFADALMSSTDSNSGSCTIADPSVTSTDLMLSGNYETSGKQTSNVGFQKMFSSDLKISTSNILISKVAQDIVSGTAVITIKGNSTYGSFNFSGKITFLGNKKATLVLNSGKVYNITWS
ncbi:MAG: hypothetical protein ACTHNW_22520 [Mucilaginibacter sp.]